MANSSRNREEEKGGDLKQLKLPSKENKTDFFVSHFQTYTGRIIQVSRF